MATNFMAATMLGAGLFLMACGGPADIEDPGADSLVTQDAALSASLACSQDFSGVTCTATVTDGIPPFTYSWTQQHFLYATNRTYTSGPTAGGATRSFSCPGPDGTGTFLYDLRARVTVTDSTGASVSTGYGPYFSCS
ncbi:hypothetical protein HUA74_25845 [Myxococcus sp. CA051A]|uniref:hypothetical protein n=1 Tax=Myxococcus sp. CA051A TaxID=2741739 RepID=UPI00157A6334|nr:hypothetical protein [Myxococcus sp. CA051A]NTX64082.1 hypothetical protein [Myxococcus sp. CA051A]